VKLQAKYDKQVMREQDLLEKLKKLRLQKKTVAWKMHLIKYHPATL